MLVKFEQVLAGIQKKIHRVNQLFVMAVIIAMVGIVAVCVFMRYVLSCGLTWSEDIVTLLFSYLIFFSIPLALRAGTHIRIELFVAKSSEAKKRVYNLLVAAIILTSLITLFLMSLNAIRQIGDSPYGGLMFPMSYFYYAAAGSAVVMFVDTVYILVKNLNEIIRLRRPA